MERGPLALVDDLGSGPLCRSPQNCTSLDDGPISIIILKLEPQKGLLVAMSTSTLTAPSRSHSQNRRTIYQQRRIVVRTTSQSLFWVGQLAVLHHSTSSRPSEPPRGPTFETNLTTG